MSGAVSLPFRPAVSSPLAACLSLCSSAAPKPETPVLPWPPCPHRPAPAPVRALGDGGGGAGRGDYVMATRVVWACASFHSTFPSPSGYLSLVGDRLCLGVGMQEEARQRDFQKHSFSCTSPPAPPSRDFLRRAPHPAFRSLGVGCSLGAFSPGAEASLGSQHFLGESTPFSVAVNCFQCRRPSMFSSPVQGLPLRERSVTVFIKMAVKSVHLNQCCRWCTGPSLSCCHRYTSVPSLPLSFLGACDLIPSCGLLGLCSSGERAWALSPDCLGSWLLHQPAK